jgi:hypothetical protein
MKLRSALPSQSAENEKKERGARWQKRIKPTKVGKKERKRVAKLSAVLGMWSHITNAQYSVSERHAEPRRHRSDWMYATREGAGGAHAAQAGAMAAYQYQDVLQRTRVPADVDVGCYKMEEYKNTKGKVG